MIPTIKSPAMKYKGTAIFFSLALMISCGQNSNNAETKTQTEKIETVQDESHPAQLGLNNGAKWEVNPEMMVYVAASEALVQNFDPSADEAYQTLASNLSENKDKLISSCTMKGASHDALHLWLEPYMGLLSELKKAETEETQKAAVDNIRDSFEAFHTFFQ
jgi:hypothetical protein